MTIKYYQLTLNFAGPLLSQASGALSMGVDTAMQRDTNGMPALNGSAIRGSIRNVLQQFANKLHNEDQLEASVRLQDQIKQWLGYGSSQFEPNRAQVQFDFFWHLQNSEVLAKKYRTRIQLDSTGKVKDGALQVLEDCFPLGSKPVFSGKLRCQFNSDTEALQFERWFKMALAYIPAMGSLKGIGFGRLLDFKLSHLPTPTSHSLGTPPALKNASFSITFTLDRPFCIGKPRIPDSNRIVSEDIIPGQVLKALIAQQYAQDQSKLVAELCFDQLSVSHFQPMQVTETEQATPANLTPPMPLSLAFVDGMLCDMSSQLWRGKQAPAFQLDWKPKEQILAANTLEHSFSLPKRILLVRTEIDLAKQTAAENKLFSLECINPAGFVWRGTISLARIPKTQQEAVYKQLQRCFESGLYGLGKTKAQIINLKYTKLPFSYPSTSAVSLKKSRITLTLMTAARLFPLGWEQNNPHQSARDLYEAYWQQTSNKSLKLVNFFAQQERLGGAYHYHHFQQKQGSYQPEWLTKAGSVFVLDVMNTPHAESLIHQWLTIGLPILEQDHITWESSPFLPEHGYGAIALNWNPIQQQAKS